MTRVLLVSMPFTNSSGPSSALGQLKPVLIRAGIACDVFYGNLAFRAFCGEPEAFDRISSLWLVGEWAFGQALFDTDYLCSERRDLACLCEVIPPKERNLAMEALKRLDVKAKPFIDYSLNALDWSRYHVVGFSSVFAQNTASLALASAIKERWPDTVIAFGGANVLGALGLHLMRLFLCVDWVVNGEGEVAFPDAVQRMAAGKSLKGIPGLTYRLPNGKIIEQGTATPAILDDLPYPDFDDYLQDLRKHASDIEEKIELPLEMSRGCWWGDQSKCIFCALNPSSERFRHKHPKRVIEEVTAQIRRYGIRRLRCVDNNTPRNFFRDLFPLLAKDVELDGFFVETMASLKKEEVTVLKAAGVRIFQPGIESLDTEHLRLMKKGTTMLHNVQLLKWARELSLRVTWNMLYGFPGEVPSSFARMMRLVPCLTHLEPPSYIFEVVLQPFSPLFEETTRHGVKNVRPNSAYKAIYPFDEKELFDMAYTLDFDRLNDFKLRECMEQVRPKFEAWKESWETGRPSMLSFLAYEDGFIKIYDTRPNRPSPLVKLEGLEAAVYLICDRLQSPRSVVHSLRGSLGFRDVTLKETRAVLDGLVERLLMVKDRGNYLALACDLNLMQRYEASPLASMLVRLDVLASTIE